MKNAVRAKAGVYFLSFLIGLLVGWLLASGIEFALTGEWQGRLPWGF